MRAHWLVVVALSCGRDDPAPPMAASSATSSSSHTSSSAQPSTSAQSPKRLPRALMEVSVSESAAASLLCWQAYPGSFVDDFRFALFDDGEVFFSVERGLDRRAKLTPAEAKVLADRIMTPEFLALPMPRQASIGQGDVEIIVRVGARWKHTFFERDKQPPSFAKSLAVIDAFRPPNAEPYEPDEVRAHFTWGALPERPEVDWPQDLPSPVGQINVNKGGSIALDGRHEGTVLALIQRGPNVKVGKRSYLLSTTRENRGLRAVYDVRTASRRLRFGR